MDTSSKKSDHQGLEESSDGYSDEKIEDTLSIIAEILEEASQYDTKISVKVFPVVLREAATEIRRLRVRLQETEATVATQQAMHRGYFH